MSINEISPEQFARLFHRYHAALAPDYGEEAAPCPGRWQDVPEPERARLVNAARLTLLELEVFPPKDEADRRKWFAKPGEAEWGC